MHSLFDSPHLTLWHDCTNQWLYVEWKGKQELETIKEICDYVLQHVPLTGFTKVLNDSTQAVGNWTAAAEWLGRDLFPRLSAVGFTHMAWVYALDFNSRFSIDSTLRCANSLTIVTFDDLDAACTWLQHADELQLGAAGC
jgi:hypothetical protein